MPPGTNLEHHMMRWNTPANRAVAFAFALAVWLMPGMTTFFIIPVVLWLQYARSLPRDLTVDGPWTAAQPTLVSRMWMSEHQDSSHEWSVSGVELSDASVNNAHLGRAWARAYRMLSPAGDQIEVSSDQHTLDEVTELLWIAFGDPDEVKAHFAASCGLQESAANWLLLLAHDDPAHQEQVRDIASDVGPFAPSDVRTQACLVLDNKPRAQSLLREGSLRTSDQARLLLFLQEDLPSLTSEELADIGRSLDPVHLPRVLRLLVGRNDEPAHLALHNLAASPPNHEARSEMVVSALADIDRQAARRTWIWALQHGGHRCSAEAVARLAADADDETLEELVLDVPRRNVDHYTESVADLLAEIGTTDHVPALRSWTVKDSMAKQSIEHAIARIQERVRHAAVGGVTIAATSGALTEAGSAGRLAAHAGRPEKAR